MTGLHPWHDLGMDDRVTSLPGGNVGGAVRIGDTVRRPTGPWTPAVHELLAHLEAAGLDGVPRVLGIDDAGREILSYLPGEGADVDPETLSDQLLAEAAQWLRRFHDTVREFRPLGPVQWRGGTLVLNDDEIICHHDPGNYNWIVDGEQLVGMVDWDMAAPGKPIDDLAFMAWNAVPLYRSLPAARVADRLSVLTSAYGDVDPVALLDHAGVRMTRATDRIEAGQRDGDPGMLNLATVGEPARTRRRVAEFRARQPEIAATVR